MASPSPSILKKVLEAGSIAHEHDQENRSEVASASVASPFAIVRTPAPEVEIAGVEHFRLMMDHVPVAMAMLDTQMRYLLANRRWMEDFKLGEQTIVGRSHYDAFPMLHPGWRHVYDRAMKGQVVRCDRDAMLRDGREMVYWWEVRPWRHADTSIGGIMILCSKLEGTNDGLGLAVDDVGEVEVSPLHGLDALWAGNLPMLQVDESGRILRASVGASMFLLPKGLREGETDFCEVLGEKAIQGPLHGRVEEALMAVLKEEKAQMIISSAVTSNVDWKGEMPTQWLFTRLGEGEALVIGLDGETLGQQELPAPAIGNAISQADETELQRRCKEAIAAEKLSRERETRLRAVLNLAPCGVLVLDEKAKLIFQNTRLVNLLGRRMEEAQRVEAWLTAGCRDEKHIRKVERSWREDVWQRQLVQVMTLVSADGLLKEVEFRPVTLPGGGMLVMLLDVTEARRSEEMLRSVEAKFRTLVQESPLALVLTDRSGSVFDANPAAEQMLGYSRAELRRMKLSQWMDEDTVAKRGESLGKLANLEKRVIDFTGTLHLADGSNQEVDLRVAVVQDSDQKALFTAHFLQPREVVSEAGSTTSSIAPKSKTSANQEEADGDAIGMLSGDDFLLLGEHELEHDSEFVREHALAQDPSIAKQPSKVKEQVPTSSEAVSQPVLRKEEVSAGHLVTESAVELLSTDAHGRIQEWSEQAQERFGYEAKEMIGRGLHLLFRPSDATGFYQDLSKQHALAFAGREVEWIFFHKLTGRNTGNFVLEAVGDSPLSVRLKAFVCEPTQAVLVVDAKVEDGKGEMTSPANMAKQRLVIGETHQRVKDQLQVISTMLNLQLNTVRNEQAREALRSSQNRISSIAALHQHLAKLAGGDPVEFRAFAGGLIARLRECYDIDEEQVALEMSISNRQMPEHWMLPLSLALNEMVSNAFKHGFANARRGVLKVSMEWNDKGGVLSVADNGKGLAPDFDDHRHEGMGLKILRVFAGQLGGEIRIATGTQGGVNVQLEFPVNASEDS